MEREKGGNEKGQDGVHCISAAHIIYHIPISSRASHSYRTTPGKELRTPSGAHPFPFLSLFMCLRHQHMPVQELSSATNLLSGPLGQKLKAGNYWNEESQLGGAPRASV